MDYCILLKYSAEDKCYIVSVPDLPGCMVRVRMRLTTILNSQLPNGKKRPNLLVNQFQNHSLPKRIFKGQRKLLSLLY